MKPSEICKAAGLASLDEFAALSGESVQTLNNWHKKRPQRFELLLLGVCLNRNAHAINGVCGAPMAKDESNAG